MPHQLQSYLGQGIIPTPPVIDTIFTSQTVDKIVRGFTCLESSCATPVGSSKLDDAPPPLSALVVHPRRTTAKKLGLVCFSMARKMLGSCVRATCNAASRVHCPTPLGVPRTGPGERDTRGDKCFQVVCFTWATTFFPFSMPTRAHESVVLASRTNCLPSNCRFTWSNGT